MELDSVHDAYQKELKRVCEKHQIELDETERRHRTEIKHLCEENSSEISNIKETLKSLYETELEKIKNIHEHEITELKDQFERRLNDLKDCDLETLTKRIEDDITKTQAKHKKIVSYLVNEIYKLKRTIISSSFDDTDKLSSVDSYDSKLLKNNLNGHDTDIETSDYVLSQDSIDNQIKDLEDIIQERDDLRSVAITLRQLTKYLCSFLIAKQEELNNSIVKHMEKMEYDEISHFNGGGDQNTHAPINENLEKEAKTQKRVHFVSNIEEIASLIDENSVLADFTNIEGTSEETNQFRTDLNACLEKLKEEAAILSNLTNSEHKFFGSNSEDVDHRSFFDRKLDYYKKELEKQKSDYKKLFKESFTLQQENSLLKEQLDKEIASVSYKNQYNDVENDNLISLHQKAQELLKNYDESPNLQNIIDEYYAECNRIIECIRIERDDLAQQLHAADRRVKTSQKFIDDQINERQAEREEFEESLETLKCRLKEKERESLDTEDLKSHTDFLVTEHKVAEERYAQLENKLLKTEDQLRFSDCEVQALKDIIQNLENQIERYKNNEMSQQLTINDLTKLLEEEQKNQHDMLAEVDRLNNLLDNQNQSYSEFVDIEIVINKIRLQLKDVEKTISKRIKDLDTFWVSEECGSPMSEDISVAERCELPNAIVIEKNSSPSRIVATLDDVFIRLQERLNRLFKSEDAIFKHESDQQITSTKLTKQIKSLESEIDMLRTRLVEKSDQLTTAKMKIDELRVLKKDDVSSATSQLQEKLQKLTTDYKQCSLIIEEQNHEIKNLKDSTKYLKNMLSTYESKLSEKENIDPNAINSLESKNIQLAEENLNLQIELANKTSQVETLTTQLNNQQSKEQSQFINNKLNHSISKSIMTDTHLSENEQMRRAIPNESNTLASLQMSYHHQDISVLEPSMLNMSLPSPCTKNHMNMHNSINEELKSTLANTKMELEEKNALIKVMEKDAELMDQQLQDLKENIKILNSEKINLEQRNDTLIENESLLADKLNDALIQLEKKQETLAELETLGVKLRAEIQPLVYMKDNLEKKISAFKDCNRVQSERIECLENINEDLKKECDDLKKNQVDLNEIKSLQHDNWTLKNELLNIEKYKVDVSEKLEELKNHYDQLKIKNDTLTNDIESLQFDKNCLKKELEKNKEFYADELAGYRNLLAEEQNKKHHVNMELLKTIEELTNQASEQQNLMSSIQENREFEITNTFSNFDLEKTPSDSPKMTIKILENELENEQQQNSKLKINIDDKNAEIEHLNTIKKYQEEKMADYIRKIQDALNHNTELELTVTKLENHIKVLENKIKIYSDIETQEPKDDLVKKLENDLESLWNTNEMLEKELTRVIDIKEAVDQKLIEAYKQIALLEDYKSEKNVLLEQLESKNQAIETYIIQLHNAEKLLIDQQTKAEKDKRLFELKILNLQKELKDNECSYKEIIKEYEVMKNYVAEKQQNIETAPLNFEKNDNLELKLEDAEKNVAKWQKKYNDLLYENDDIKNKFENMSAECSHLQNKMTELQYKLSLSNHYKNRLKSDIEGITAPAVIEQGYLKLIVNLENENATLTRELTEVREKYNKCRAHIKEIKAVLTHKNLKTVVQENIELCNKKDELQKEVSDLKCHVQDLKRKLLEKGECHKSIVGNQQITRIEALYHSLVWQKMYLVKLAGGKDKLLRFIIQEWPALDNSIIKTTFQKICAKQKISKFKIAAICIIAVHRMKTITLKHIKTHQDLTLPQLELTHFNLPKKIPWIKC